MLLLDARKIRVANRTNDIPALTNTEHVRQAEIGPPLVALVVHAGFECSQQRTSGIHVSAQLPALLVAEQRGVRQQQRGVLGQVLRR